MPQNNAELFKSQGYVKVASVLSPEMCELIAKYVCLKAKARPNSIKSDSPLGGVHREYGDPMMETLLEHLQETVEQATDLALWPTLSFYYHYQKGNDLKPHKDRESCEIVAGLCIGADQDYRKSNGTWPLLLKDAPPIHLDYGDIIIFKGSSTEHWRESFTGSWFVSAILGYVDRNGPFAHQRFDQRAGLGKAHVGMLAWTVGELKAKVFNLFS